MIDFRDGDVWMDEVISYCQALVEQWRRSNLGFHGNRASQRSITRGAHFGGLVTNMDQERRTLEKAVH